MPLEWQSVVIDIYQMKIRIDFGAVVHDRELSDRQKVAAECYQNVLQEEANKRPSGCAFMQPKT